MSQRISPNDLPSGTSIYFLVIIITSVAIAFWSGQFLPPPIYFTTPFGAQFQPGLYSIYGGFYGIGLLLPATIFFCIRYSRHQRYAFGPSDEINPEHPVWSKVLALSKASGVKRLKTLLHDRNISNADAISFGLLNRTILLGKGLLLMEAKGNLGFSARIGHELGHFRNGDVKYAVLARALVQANLLMMGIIVIWLCIRPARVVIMQYFLFTSPMMGLPGASAGTFFRLHGGQWAAYWLNQAIGSLMITAPVFAFWIALLFLEYRSLLRTRELLADARSAALVGDEALFAAFGKDHAAARLSLSERLYELFSPHPLLDHRIRAIRHPENALAPSLLRFLFLGFLWSLTNYLISSVNVMFSILSTQYGNLSQLDPMSAAITVFRSSNTTAAILYVSILSMRTASYLILVATLLRSSFSSALSGERALRWGLVTLGQIACVIIGALMADVFHPYGQPGQAQLASEVMRGQPLSGIFFTPIGTAAVAQYIWTFLQLLGMSVMFRIATTIILRGARARPVGWLAWSSLVGFTFLFVYQLSASVWAVINFPLFRTLTFLLSSAIYVTLFFAFYTGSVRVIRGKRAGGITPNYLPIWLTRS